jgi:tetratricopeptide (TPR) repeat protein
MVRIWDALTLKPMLSLEIPPGDLSTTSLAVSGDGRRVAAAVGMDVRVWSSVSAYHPDASGLVDRLFKELVFADAVSARIRGDDGLDPKLREAALLMVQSFGDHPGRLNSAGWEVAKSPGHDGAAYTMAVQRARRAVQLAPWEARYLNTLGVARYRTGDWKAALVTLERAAAMRETPSPGDLAFLAMAHQRLGQRDAALAALEQLRAEMKKPDNGNNEALRGFLREAEALVLGVGAKPSVPQPGRK